LRCRISDFVPSKKYQASYGAVFYAQVDRWGSKRYAGEEHDGQSTLLVNILGETVHARILVSDHDERLLGPVHSWIVGDVEAATTRADKPNYNLTADKYDGLNCQRSKSGS
jgi:hypothetical protein